MTYQKFDPSSERQALEELSRIGEAFGYGWAQQQLGIMWDNRHGCAPRGKMGVTVKDGADHKPEPRGFMTRRNR